MLCCLKLYTGMQCYFRDLIVAFRLVKVPLSITPFQLSGLVLKFFKISLALVIGNFQPHIHVQQPNFSLIANFHNLSVAILII